MFKKALSVIVLIIFLAHFVGFYIYFFTQLQVVRQEMRAKLKELPREELELIVLSPAEYKKAKVEEHEIKVDGKMYDIAWIVEKNGKVLVHCLHDAAEDNLLAFLDKILSLPLKDKNVPSGVLQFMSLNFLPTHWNFLTPEFQKTQSFTHYAEMLSLFKNAIASPPPKI